MRGMTEPDTPSLRARSGARVIGIVGWKNSGKTTLVERLIAELSRRGLRIASIKHAHHSFDIDHAGTDSDRHRRAGAGEVLVISRRRWAMIGELDGIPEPPLTEVLGWFSHADLILVEGYKSEPIPKIEVRRTGASHGPPLTGTDPQVIAVAADSSAETHGRPLLALDDFAAIADFIMAWAGLRSVGAAAGGLDRR